MPTTFSTIAIASQPHLRHTEPKKRAPLGPEQKKERKEAREDKQQRIDAAASVLTSQQVSKWFSDTMALAEKLAEEFDMKPKYFHELFFQGGARMVIHQATVNPYNAFKSEKAAECWERGETKDAPQLHADHFDEYKHLTDAEKDELVERWVKHRNSNVTLRRATPRAKIQDVANIVRNMKVLMYGLSTRVGIEGFFCVVRNSPDFHMAPQWFFTSRELEQYMPIVTRQKWVTAEVGTKVEAFAVAGCNVVNMLRTSKQKADFFKAGIREGLTEKLVEITGDPTAQMAYVWYEEDIVHKYGVILVGWTYDEPVNPSELSTSLPGLQKLYDAIKNDSCKFVKLTGEERVQRIADWKADVAAGRIEQKTRATRADKGKKRTRATRDDDNEDDADADEEDVDAARGAGNSGDDETPVARPVKRRRITAKIAPADRPVVEEPEDDDVAQPAESQKQGARDDEATRKALALLKGRQKGRRDGDNKESAGQASGAPPVPRPKPRPLYNKAKAPATPKSKEMITSEDEREADPDADADDDNVPAPSTNRVAAAAEFDAALAQVSTTPA
ncbi:hypothetical protein B0H16DRAFT_1735740 [Mycena metata]|uniref:Uncharacterized protein n=1 Tax=Mycena metata TaxID=1033252 RepID=A0AAD7HSA2_9AGAR|nr:hypothetical protein B0H16DRAFT_1735740 [Mycena metata]